MKRILVILVMLSAVTISSANESCFIKRGEQLREVAFPLGGIGAGNISIDGRGALRDIEIFNHPNKGFILPDTFPIIWCKPQGQDSQCRVIQGPRNRDFIGYFNDGFSGYGNGAIREQGDGLPCFSNVEFEGQFPVARIKFQEPNFPLEVKLMAFSPFIPLDANNSGMPVAFLLYTLTNHTKVSVDATVALNLFNATEMATATFGFDLPNKGQQTQTVYRKGDNCSGLWMTSTKYDANDSKFGTMALTTDWADVTYLPQWQRSYWFDGMHNFWDQFSKTGTLDPNSATSENGNAVSGTLGLRVTLKPGESAQMPILVSWCFPNLMDKWGKTYYFKLWPTAWDASEYFYKNKKSLTERTTAFENSFYSSTLPPEVLDAAGSNASILHSPTCLRLEDGTFWAWEGCSTRKGSCPGSCTHVWNYSLAPAYLFPQLHRTMRISEYKYSFDSGEEGKKGAVVFRIPLPLGTPAKLRNAAVDGQLGGVVQLYRDWRFCGNDEYLKSMWPSAKRALEYSWSKWDCDKDGFIEGQSQHNTYDINFNGHNPLSQFFYLAALKAGEKMAAYCGDSNSAAEYSRLYAQGRKKTEEILYNGQYFIQTTDCLEPNAPKYQFGKGCLSDQIFGELCAEIAGLGELVDSNMIDSALKSVYKYNFRSPLGDHANMQRIYAVQDESGLLLCSWPNGGRPKYPFVYSDEVWTGIEYQVANHLIYRGMFDQGLEIVKAVRNRYDGTRRNPFNEFECGSHYARAMASWGLINSISGFKYDAVEKTVYITPRGPQKNDMKCFFSTETAWGMFEYKSGKLTITPIEGEFTVEKIVNAKCSVEVSKKSQKVSQSNALSVKIM